MTMCTEEIAENIDGVAEVKNALVVKGSQQHLITVCYPMQTYASQLYGCVVHDATQPVKQAMRLRAILTGCDNVLQAYTVSDLDVSSA